MIRALPILIVLLVLGVPETLAQQRTPAGAPPDLNALPISVERIKKKMAAMPATKPGEGLRLEYYVEVYGKLVPIDVIGGFDLRTGPVPYGAPTHTEMVQFVTPQEFRAPAADLLAPARALIDWLAGRGANRQR